MNKIIKFVLVFSFCFVTYLGKSQTAAEIVRKVDKALLQNYPDYHELELELLVAKELDPQELDVDYLLAIVLLEQSGRADALQYVKAIIESGEVYSRDFDFYRAYLEHRRENFDQAIKFYNIFLSKLSKSELELSPVLSVTNYLILNIKLGFATKVVELANLGQIVENKIGQCKSAKIITKQPKDIHFINLGYDINSTFDEYSPVYSAIDSTLYFTSRRPIPDHLKKDEGDELFLEHIFEADHKSGIWTKATFEEEPLNSFTHNVSALAINRDGNDIFLFDHRNNGDIMHSKKIKTANWTVPVAFSQAFNTTKVERSFAISDDGKLVIIERDGNNLNDRDLYYSTFDGKDWSLPITMGPTINTPFEEDGVFLHKNGKVLYFSSKGHNSIGGYDVFKTEWQDSSWSKPINLGYPINSVYDDIYFVISDDEKFGFLSSNRPGGYGGFDNYYLDLKPNPLEQEIVVNIIDKENSSKLADVRVVLIDVLDKTEYPMKRMPDGSYEVKVPNKDTHTKFKITAKKTNFGLGSEDINVSDDLNFFDAGTISLKEIKPEIIKFVFNDVYLFDVNSSKFFDKYHDRLDVLINALNDNNVIINIEGHTDNSGGAEYNQKLSEKRAESVRQYLIGKGVKPEQIKSVGYGEEKPLNDNSSRELRQENRRVVVTLLD